VRRQLEYSAGTVHAATESKHTRPTQLLVIIFVVIFYHNLYLLHLTAGWNMRYFKSVSVTWTKNSNRLSTADRGHKFRAKIHTRFFSSPTDKTNKPRQNIISLSAVMT